MVHIDSNYFGSIIIDGNKYDDDIIVDWKGNVRKREKSHVFSNKEFLDILFDGPEAVVVGTGMSGMMKIEPEVQVKASMEGIEFIAMKTSEAVREFNKICKRKKVIGIFHVTC